MKEKIKIPDWIVKKAASHIVAYWMAEWGNDVLKKAGIPSRAKLIAELIKSFKQTKSNNDELEDTMLDIVKSNFSLYDSVYDEKCAQVSAELEHELETTTLEDQLVKRIKNMGYKVEKIKK
jgi:hypothetical protein